MLLEDIKVHRNPSLPPPFLSCPRIVKIRNIQQKTETGTVKEKSQIIRWLAVRLCVIQGKIHELQDNDDQTIVLVVITPIKLLALGVSTECVE